MTARRERCASVCVMASVSPPSMWSVSCKRVRARVMQACESMCHGVSPMKTKTTMKMI
jgi:hypothetical protein